MQEPRQDLSPITNWKQLVVIVALAFIVPIVVIILLTQYVTDTPVQANENDSAVLNRIKPVGEVLREGGVARSRRHGGSDRRRHSGSGRQSGWQEDLRRDVFGLPRHWRCRRTQIR